MTVAADRPQGRPDAGPDPSGPDCGLGEDVLQHLPALRAYARSLCRRTQDPDDLVQETLLRAIEFAQLSAGHKAPGLAVYHHAQPLLQRLPQARP